MTPAANDRMIARIGRLMILADTYECRLCIWYRLQRYANRRARVRR
jgi:hypothetical protein